MKIVCKVCRHEIEIDESRFSPGDRVEVECHRCGWFDEIEIPAREPEESKPSVRLVSPAEPQAEPLPEVPSPEPVPQVRSVPDPIRRRRKPAKPEVSEVSEPVSTPVTPSSEVRPVRETVDETPVRKPERRRTVPQSPTPVPAPVTPVKPRRNQRQQNTPSRARGKGVRFGDILVVLVLAALFIGGGRAYSFLADCYHRVFGSSEKVEAAKLVAVDEPVEEIPLEERMAVEEEHLAYEDLAPADSVVIPYDENADADRQTVEIVEDNNDRSNHNGEPSTQQGSYKLTGKVKDKYEVHIWVTIRGNEIHGKYCYTSTVKKYGDHPASYININGQINSDGYFRMTASTVDSSYSEEWEGSFSGNRWYAEKISEPGEVYVMKAQVD